MLKIKTLNKDHDRTDFDCGTNELNKYLRKTARQHLDKGMSRTLISNSLGLQSTNLFVSIRMAIFLGGWIIFPGFRNLIWQPNSGPSNLVFA